MSIFTATQTNNNPLTLQEGLASQATKPIAAIHNQITEANQPAISQPLVKLNLLDTLEFITSKITELEDTESYLQARTEFLEVLKRCEKRLARHEENKFINLMNEQETDTLRFGRYEVTYQLSKKTVIDSNKLKNALETTGKPEQFNLFLKESEFKTLPKCRHLLKKLNILSDVYGIKEGKKLILNIVDTNTIKQEVESIETAETEEEREE